MTFSVSPSIRAHMVFLIATPAELETRKQFPHGPYSKEK